MSQETSSREDGELPELEGYAVAHKGGVTLLMPNDDFVAPIFLVRTGPLSDEDRGHILELSEVAYESLVPGAIGRAAAEEAVRLMDEESRPVGDGYRVLVHSLPICNRAWLSVGVPPEVGDQIALIKQQRAARSPVDPSRPER